MSGNFRPVIAEKIPKSKFYFRIDKVDYEVKLVDRFGPNHQAISKDQIGPQGAKLRNLFPRRRYVLRYNNRDRGMGFIVGELIQVTPDRKEISIYSVSLKNIKGPIVIEIPFYITYTAPR